MSGIIKDNQGRSSGLVKTGATTYDDDKLQSNIALLGFKTAANGSLAKYSLQDQIIDEYEDATGIDASASTNEILASGSYGSSATSTNYFGDDSDGTVTTSGDVTHTVLSKNGSYDGDMLVKDYTNLTISSGDTMTVDQPCRGMLIFVSGNCVINGTLSMKSKGALGNPASSGGSDSNSVQSAGIQIGFVTGSGSSSFTNADTNFNGCGTTARTAIANFGNTVSNGDTVTVVRTGGSGAASVSYGNNGTDGGVIANGTGGGGSGAAFYSTATSGAGTAGTCFAGGSGGGGASKGTGSGGTSMGGAGGSGGSSHNAWTGGGAGNPGAANQVHGGWTGGTPNTAEGLGGLLILIVQGNLTVGASGVITAQGGRGGGVPLPDSSGAAGGGCGGGGRLIYAYGGTLSNSGSITAAGGVSTSGEAGAAGPGGSGGAGVVTGLAVTPAAVYNDLTLQSTDTTAMTEPDYADMVMLMENAAGTATINTDIKGYISKDSGVTFTEGTLVDEGTWGTNKKIYAFHDLDISAQSGTAMCYKVTTHNQSVSKQTKLHAASIGWK
jgi:hypothetical protein